MGAIGVMLNGVSLFNAVDEQGRDAVVHEVQDKCDGHPEQRGTYHYHNISRCLSEANTNKLLGYALDGFGIYGYTDENGKEIDPNLLDECRGMISEVEWNGKKTNIYHYVATKTFPYTLGCFKGEVRNI
jgi:hypothetical protein